MNLVFKHKTLLRALFSDTVQLLFVLLAGTGGDIKRGVERPHGRHGDARGGLWWWTLSELARKAAWATLAFERRLLLASGHFSRWLPSHSATGALSTKVALPRAACHSRLPLLMFVIDFPWFTVSDQVT